jgi:hypothetical protein
MPPLLLEQLSAIAHELWCDRMRRDGWTPGPTYDARARVHDAIRPFSGLSGRDQRDALDATRASGAVELLGRCINYARGPDAPAPFASLQPSARVRLVRTDRLEEIKVGPHDVGVVEDVVRAGSEIGRVFVRWPSGDQSVHVAGDDDLALAEGP